MRVNREHKDRLFKFIFQKKENLLELYNALNGTSYDNPEDLESVWTQNNSNSHSTVCSLLQWRYMEGRTESIKTLR